jgi:two-component sensor histidine kinase
MARRPTVGLAAESPTPDAKPDALQTARATHGLAGRSAKEIEGDALGLETDHRVKNLLASVQSLAAQSARHAGSMDGFLDSFMGRIDALATAYTLLAATRWRGADVGAVAASVLGGLSQGRVAWAGPDILLNPRATNALTLALHELGANAVKFGALSTPAGRIDVGWRVSQLGGFELEWVETGGPAPDPDSRYGFGRTLIERVTGRELGGAGVLELTTEGVRVRLAGGATALADSRAQPGPPALSGEPQGASSGTEGLDGLGGIRVLIVEDALLLALELEAGLTEAGAQVVGVASDLEEARRLANLDFDVAVLDANLNGQSVTPIAHTLARRGTPFIFATGYRDMGADTASFDAPVVLKPYNVRQIAAALRIALAASG